jgi:hypothetical protein
MTTTSFRVAYYTITISVRPDGTVEITIEPPKKA